MNDRATQRAVDAVMAELRAARQRRERLAREEGAARIGVAIAFGGLALQCVRLWVARRAVREAEGQT